jgi:DNA-binding Xre family transcriptional regulator
VQTHWKLDLILRRHGKTPMALARASGLTKTTIYNMVNNSSKAVQLETLDKLVAGLEKLTGRRISVSDVLEREVKPNALLEELMRDAKPVHWAEVEHNIPQWTAAERAENEAFLTELHHAKQQDYARSLEREPVDLKTNRRSSVKRLGA